MKIIVSGGCGFVGSALITALLDTDSTLQIAALDNFSRPGSQTNREPLQERGVKLFHADMRNPSDLEGLPAADWIIDAAANPAVLAGIDGRTSSRQLLEHNLLGTINLLELAKEQRAGFILLSTSRVYSIEPLAALPVISRNDSFVPSTSDKLPIGATNLGISEQFDTRPPVSLYGASKLASETVALEYGATFDFPVWINRCGVLAGAGQFGRIDQGVFAFWINSYLRREPMSYIGFDGTGFQTRDCLHPRDLVPLIIAQMREGKTEKPRTINLGGGAEQAMSLAQLSDWCSKRFPKHSIGKDLRPRPFDIPWLVMDTSLALQHWGWRPETPLAAILEEIATHAETHPDWLKLSAAL
jgi:CDP-paratose 2-epimerase